MLVSSFGTRLCLSRKLLNFPGVAKRSGVVGRAVAGRCSTTPIWRGTAAFAAQYYVGNRHGQAVVRALGRRPPSAMGADRQEAALQAGALDEYQRDAGRRVSGHDRRPVIAQVDRP